MSRIDSVMQKSIRISYVGNFAYLRSWLDSVIAQEEAKTISPMEKSILDWEEMYVNANDVKEQL
jgi:hypothetical protein